MSEALISIFEQLKWEKIEKASGIKCDTRRKISLSSFSTGSSPMSPHRFASSKTISPASVESKGTDASPEESDQQEAEEEFDDEEPINAVEIAEPEAKPYSAEGVARSLISKFSDKQLPSAADLQWLITEQDVPQKLLPMPEGNIVNPDDNCPITLIRGTREWAPPRQQVIFTRHPPPE